MDYDTLVNNTLNALCKKEELIYDFLRITQEADFAGKISEVDIYTDYLDKRQSIIDKVDELDILISRLCKMNDINDNIEIVNKKNAIKKTIEKIIVIDDNIKCNMNTLLDEVGERLRARNVHRSAQRQYRNSTNSYGAFLDVKN